MPSNDVIPASRVSVHLSQASSKPLTISRNGRLLPSVKMPFGERKARFLPIVSPDPCAIREGERDSPSRPLRVKRKRGRG
jgi:hypothetical protein